MDKKDNVIQCGLCYKWLKNKKNYQRHKREVHNANRKKWNCPEVGCESTFTRRSHVRKHLLKIHKMYKDTNNNKMPKIVTNRSDENKCDTIFVNSDKYSDISDGEFILNEDNKIGDFPNTPDLQDLDVDSFINYLEEEEKKTQTVSEANINHQQKDTNTNILDTTTETVILTLRKTITRYLDGKEEVNRETSINYSVNVDMAKINISDIVNRTTDEINDFLKSKSTAKCTPV